MVYIDFPPDTYVFQYGNEVENVKGFEVGEDDYESFRNSYPRQFFNDTVMNDPFHFWVIFQSLKVAGIEHRISDYFKNSTEFNMEECVRACFAEISDNVLNDFLERIESKDVAWFVYPANIWFSKDRLECEYMDCPKTFDFQDYEEIKRNL